MKRAYVERFSVISTAEIKISKCLFLYALLKNTNEVEKYVNVTWLFVQFTINFNAK